MVTRTIELPEADAGYEWTMEPVLPMKGEKYFSCGRIAVKIGEFGNEVAFTQRKKPVKKVDWSKFADDVLLGWPGGPFFRSGGVESPAPVYSGWQVHHGQDCPVDSQAFVVDVRLRDGSAHNGEDAECFEWRHDSCDEDCHIIAYRVTGLAEGYEL